MRLVPKVPILELDSVTASATLPEAGCRCNIRLVATLWGISVLPARICQMPSSDCVRGDMPALRFVVFTASFRVVAVAAARSPVT